MSFRVHGRKRQIAHIIELGICTTYVAKYGHTYRPGRPVLFFVRPLRLCSPGSS